MSVLYKHILPCFGFFVLTDFSFSWHSLAAVVLLSVADEAGLLCALHCVSKNVPTFQLSVTLSNLNRFSHFCTAGKLVKFATKTHNTTHLTLGMLLHYLGISKIQIFCKYTADMKNANKLHFQCTDFNSSVHVTVFAECIYVFLSKSCPCR